MLPLLNLSIKKNLKSFAGFSAFDQETKENFDSSKVMGKEATTFTSSAASTLTAFYSNISREERSVRLIMSILEVTYGEVTKSPGSVEPAEYSVVPFASESVSCLMELFPCRNDCYISWHKQWFFMQVIKVTATSASFVLLEFKPSLHPPSAANGITRSATLLTHKLIR